jgi:hypothetical protein
MLLRELINQTIRMKDEIKQRRTICQMGLITMKEEIRDIQRRWDNELSINRLEIETNTDFKSKGITNQKQRDAFVLEEQRDMRKEMMEELDDQKFLIANAEEREKQLWDEYRYYEDRLEFLLKVYDIEGEIELEESITKDREVLGVETDDGE